MAGQAKRQRLATAAAAANPTPAGPTMATTKTPVKLRVRLFSDAARAFIECYEDGQRRPVSDAGRVRRARWMLARDLLRNARFVAGACDERDEKGRTPLHWLPELAEADRDVARVVYMYIHLTGDAYLRMCSAEDMNGTKGCEAAERAFPRPVYDDESGWDDDDVVSL